MDVPFSLILDVFVAILLVVTICYAYVLNRKLTAIRRDRAQLESVAASFAQATLRAEESIRKLKASADGLQGQIDKSDSLREDLAFLVQRGSQAADRLEELVREARKVEPSTARPARAAPEPKAGEEPEGRGAPLKGGLAGSSAPQASGLRADANALKPGADGAGGSASGQVSPRPEPKSAAERELLKALQSVR